MSDSAIDPTRTPLNTLAHMRDAVFFDGPGVRPIISRFWLLLVLSSVIAAVGVMSDSTATVIGAMIVAPLMLPIQGTMLATVVADRGNLIRSFGMLVAGSLAAIAIGFALGVLDPLPVVAATNSQVAARVSPGLLDLIAALATGIVGSIALVRKDISDTLPGVAIAISLVPPLVVVGLTLESGEPLESLGALLLFLTNVTAIIATGAIVMGIYRVVRPGAVQLDAKQRRARRRNRVLITLAGLIVIVLPLLVSTFAAILLSTQQSEAAKVADTWAAGHGWELVSTETRGGEIYLRLEGPTPVPATSGLRQALDDAGVVTDDVHVRLTPAYLVDFGSDSD
jgi:uncharacterized hydrophobic protein (TIGR00271 family)